MSELRRLLESDATDAERALLRAGMEQPDSKMVQRAAAALGVSASVLTVAQVSAAGTQAAVVAGGKAVAASAPLALSIGKWLVVVGVVGAAGVGTYQVVRAPGAVPAKAPAAAAPPRAAVSPPLVAVPPGAQVSEEAPSVAAPPAARGASRGEPKPSYTSVAHEVKAIGQIRSAVSGGDARQALALLDAYDRRFVGGALRQEATLLRVQALQLSGDRKGAQALGERFIEANPHSPHQERVRGLLGGGAGPAAKSEGR